MSPRIRWIALASTACVPLLSVACGSRIEVRTMVAPDAGLEMLSTFTMLPGPARRDGQPVTGADDPMINNSIANRALRERIAQAFEDRGYARDGAHADFAVAFYATARERLDVTAWDYGYPFNPHWRVFGPPAPTVTQYTEGSVIVDVVRVDTHELLWRGQGVAPLSSDPADNVKQLADAAAKIVERFPRARARAVAAAP